MEGITEDERQLLGQKLHAITNKDGCIFMDVDDERYQERNRAIALSRLESRIMGALKKQKKRIKTKPSKESNERRLKSKKIKSEIKRNRKAFK